MITILLPITLTMAGAAALLNIWLGMRVGNVRRDAKVLTGDGGHPALTARMRAQANFVENTPFFLILLGLIELGRGSAMWLWVVGIAFILGRIVHAFGMDGTKLNGLRMAGILITWLVLLGLAGYAIFLAYQAPGITVGGAELRGGR